jgi:hypothetical protein
MPSDLIVTADRHVRGRVFIAVQLALVVVSLFLIALVIVVRLFD